MITVLKYNTREVVLLSVTLESKTVLEWFLQSKQNLTVKIRCSVSKTHNSIKPVLYLSQQAGSFIPQITYTKMLMATKTQQGAFSNFLRPV